MNRLVYVSPVPWDSFSQRPHKFAEWFHESTQGEVLWLDPYPTRLPRLSDFTHRPQSSSLPRARAPWLTVVSPRALPMEPIPVLQLLNRYLWKNIQKQVVSFCSGGDALLVAGKPSELALVLLKDRAIRESVYDAMDDFPSFYQGVSKWAMRQREQVLATKVDHILTSSTVLLERLRSLNRVSLCMNACDLRSLPRVADLQPRPRKKLLGYVGTLGPWLDWKLVLKLAACPEVRIRLIGPLFSPPSMVLPDNIELLPQCTHEQAILAMQTFDVGLIPFKKTELTSSVDPIKFYEYRALGLPVLSTSFGEMQSHRQQPGVFIVDELQSLGDISFAIDQALAFTSPPDEIERFRAENSWNSRFDSTHLL
ncbi:glycosyl transferase [Pseudomonas nitroreducens]|uniref:glycosyl transferase n=1 Tax=Pseudomonas nitroreducens TaxID=46680 RepID=UPI002D7F02E3|nr:glycosyl transferase [Pseudomonas nitroreducens]